MHHVAVNDGLNVQSGVNPTALLCAPTFANVKPLEIAKNAWNRGNKEASSPNSLNSALNNYEKLTFNQRIRKNVEDNDVSQIQCSEENYFVFQYASIINNTLSKLWTERSIRHLF